MKLTLCSLTSDDKISTYMILKDHRPSLEAANICCHLGMIVTAGDFRSMPVPEDLEALYAPHVDRILTAEEFEKIEGGA